MKAVAGPASVVERLIDAVNRRDLEALMSCFASDVRSELPTQPQRGSQGRDYLRSYWEAVLGGAGDIRAELKRCAVDGDTVLAEWCWHGRRADGTSFARAGVTVHGIGHDQILWQRLYMEPVQGDPETVGAWVLREMGRPTAE